MASSFFRRLTQKYDSENLKGKKYQKVINEIIAHNSEKIGSVINRLTNKNYKESLKKLSKEKTKTVKLPDLSEVLPKQSVFLIKAADSGKVISDTLRSRLEKDLRGALGEFDGTGKKRMEIQRGTATGKINPELIKLFQEKITGTFENYTKRDKKTGVPSNVKNIAVTEIRSTIGLIKDSYIAKLKEKNPNLVFIKTWIHNRGLSKKPRQYHIEMNGVTIWEDEKFKVPRGDGSGFDYMTRPHDPEAPLGQIIGCNCDYIIKARIE